MSVLHPVGPEEPRTYWLRRAAVVASFLLVVLVAVWAFRPDGDPDLEAVPGTTPSSTATVDPVASRSPSASTSPTPSASSSASATAGDDASSEQDDDEAETEAQKKADAEKKAESEKKADAEKDEAEEKAEAEEEAEPARCASEDLRVTLTGSSTPSVGEDHALDLSVINGTSGTCELTVNQDSFELRIYSGTDRIWTTDRCAEWVPSTTVTLEREQAHGWTTTWPGRRSDDDCTLGEDPLRPGTYVATAVYEEAEPVQLVMQLG